jgi:hypothetical protein
LASSTTDYKSRADEKIPDTRPDWDSNTPNELQSIQHMRQAILEGDHQGARGATNLAKISEVTQKPDELPNQFHDRLYDAYCQYTPFDPEALTNQPMINTIFIQQSAPGVRQKLQKIEGFTDANTDQLISIAAKVVAQTGQCTVHKKESRPMKQAKENSEGWFITLEGRLQYWKRQPQAW